MMQEREIHLRDYIRVLKRRRYTVYTFFIIVLGVVLIGTLSSTPLYTASTKLLIERQFAAGLTTPYYYLPYDPEFYETQYQLIKSASVAERVIRMLSLPERHKYYFGKESTRRGIISTIKGWFNGGSSSEASDRVSEEELKVMYKNMIMGGIKVSPVKKSKIVQVSFESPSPLFAADVVNAVAKAYMEELMEMKMKSSKYKLQWLSKKAEEERKKLQRSEEALQRYMKENDIVTLENRIAIIPQRLTELSTELTRAEAKRKSLESLYQRIEKIVSEDIEKAETIPIIASDSTIKALRKEILEAEQNIMELSKKFGRKHPKMKRALSELEVLKEKKRQEIRRVIESIRTDYELAKANEMNLRRLLQKTKEEALRLNEKFIQYGVLRREVETNKQLFEALIKKIKEESVTEKIQTVNVWIVEEAKVPKVPTKPKKGLNILLGIIVGVLGGIGLAFFVEYLDNTIKTPEEAEERLGLPVIGMVSLVEKDNGDLEKMTLKETSSVFAENLKALRTSIFLSFADRPPKSILVTSPGPDEGKSTIASNLAIVVAQSEYSVLLVDADLRNPQLHRAFGLDNSEGLSTYLAGTSDIENIIQQGPLPRMSILTAGPLSPNPSELLSSKRLGDLIETMKQRYDMIILDSPPLMTVSDGVILSSVVEGTILVTKAASTTYDIAMRAIKSLRDIKANLLGVVINSIDLRKEEYYYYRYYGYYSAEEETQERSMPQRIKWWFYLPITVAVIALLGLLLQNYFQRDIPERDSISEGIFEGGTSTISLKRYVVTTDADIRQNPSMDSPIIGKLKPYIAVMAAETEGGWYVVYSEEGRIMGYVPSEHLKPIE